MTPDRTVKALEVPRLVVKLADGKEVHHHLAGKELTIGRDPSNKICLTDHFVSKFHAKLVKAASGPEPQWVLTDLGSANKTYVNGEAITEATVKLGDTVRFASVECRVAPPEVAERANAAARRAPAPAPAPAPAVPSSAPSSAPPVPVPSRPEPKAPPPPPPSAPRASARPQAGSAAAPKIEADPMKRLLTIGAILILISLVLGIILRILLVPSETPPAEAGSGSGSGSGSGAETAGSAPGASTPPDAGATASSGQAAGGPATSARSVDASGNRTAEFYFEEGLSYLDTGRLKDAQASLRKVVELDPDHTRAKTRLSLLDEEIERQAQLHFDNAREAFQFLRYDEAIAEWEMFLLLADPGDVRYAEAQQGIQQAQSRLR